MVWLFCINYAVINYFNVNNNSNITVPLSEIILLVILKEYGIFLISSKHKIIWNCRNSLLEWKSHYYSYTYNMNQLSKDQI